jgi:hypothetical protein
MATSPSRANALAPAGIGLALFVAVTQLRMDDPWGNGVLMLVAAVPAVVLLALGLFASDGDSTERAGAEILLVAGLVMAGVAIARLGEVLAGGDGGSGGGTLTWMLALFTAIAAYCANRARSGAALLVGSVAAVGLLLAAINWIFGTEDIDVYRVLLVLAFVVLLGAGVAIGGRAGTLLAAAAGVTVIASFYVTGFVFLLGGIGGDNQGWGWELISLLEAAGLLVYAVQRLEPGPAYFAFFVFVIFATTAAATEPGIIGPGDSDDPSGTLVGWPLALGLTTVALAAYALRPRT